MHSKEIFVSVLLVQYFISGQYIHTCFAGYAARIFEHLDIFAFLTIFWK